MTFFSNSFYLRILCIIKLHFLSLLHQVLCNSQIIIHVKSWRVFSRWQETLLKVKLDIHYVSLSPDSTLHKAKLSCSLIPFSCYSLHCPSDYGARFFLPFLFLSALLLWKWPYLTLISKWGCIADLFWNCYGDIYIPDLFNTRHLILALLCSALSFLSQHCAVHRGAWSFSLKSALTQNISFKY